MSKIDEKLALYREFVDKHGIKIDDELLAKVTVGMGPSIFKKDAELIACSDKDELERVRENFLKKKLALTQNDDELDKAIHEVCDEIGSSVKNKFRAVFYALLVEKLNKQSIYA